MLASSVVAEAGAVKYVMDAWLREDRLEVIGSEEIYRELEDTLRKPYFAKRITEERRRAYIELVRSASECVETRTMVRGVARDPADDHVIALALDAGARYVVTGDRDLLVIGAYRGIQFITPRDLVSLL